MSKQMTVTLACCMRNGDSSLLTVSGTKGAAQSADKRTHSISRSRDNYHGRQPQTSPTAGHALCRPGTKRAASAGTTSAAVCCPAWQLPPVKQAEARFEAVQPGSQRLTRAAQREGGTMHKAPAKCERNLGITTCCAGSRTSPVHGGCYSSPCRYGQRRDL